MNKKTPVGIWKLTHFGIETYLSFDNHDKNFKSGFYKKFINDGESLSREGGSWYIKRLSLLMLPMAVEGKYASEAGIEKRFEIAYFDNSIRIIDIVKDGEIKTYDFHKIEEWPFED